LGWQSLKYKKAVQLAARSMFVALLGLTEAISERQRALEISGGAPLFIAELADSCAAAGAKRSFMPA